MDYAHKSMLKYFWSTKRDLECYAQFEEIKPMLESEHPEILKAWNDYKMSEKTLTMLIKKLVEHSAL
jgi:hypothetical protein